MNEISRRSVLRGIGVAGAGVAFGGTVLSRATTARAATGAPQLTVLTDLAGAAPGSIFYTQSGPQVADGLVIADRHGVTTHFQPVDGSTADFRVQAYQGDRRLTWWQGAETPGQAQGSGVDYLADSSYQVVGSIGTVAGLSPDMHEFRITPQNTALIIANELIPYDLSGVGGAADGQLVDCLWLEVDIATSTVLRQWRASEHVPLTDSYVPVPTDPTMPYDWFHMNSVNPDDDGNILVSSRHTWTVYKVRRTSGAVLWRLGGKRSDFALGADATFSWQHNALPAGGGVLRLFDNASNGASTQRPASRVIWLRLETGTDAPAGSARLVRSLVHPDGVVATFMGNAQALPNGNTFVGWGGAARLSEFDGSGRLVFDATLPGPSYRCYRMPWSD